MTLAVIDMTFRVWSKSGESNIVAITDDVLATLTGLVADLPAPSRMRRRPRRGLPKPE